MIAGYTPLAVMSGSMEPDFPTGSIIYYGKAGFNDISADDIIAFSAGSKDSYIVHRVVSVDSENKQFTTKGDANKSADTNAVKFSDVAGKVGYFCIPYAGYYVSFIVENLWIAVIAAVIVLTHIIFIFIGRDRSKHYKKKLKAYDTEEEAEANKWDIYASPSDEERQKYNADLIKSEIPETFEISSKAINEPTLAQFLEKPTETQSKGYITAADKKSEENNSAVSKPTFMSSAERGYLPVVPAANLSVKSKKNPYGLKHMRVKNTDRS